MLLCDGATWGSNSCSVASVFISEYEINRAHMSEFWHKIVNRFFTISLNSYFVCLIGTVLLSTHIIFFGREIRTLISDYTLLSGALEQLKSIVLNYFSQTLIFVYENIFVAEKQNKMFYQFRRLIMQL